MLVHRIIGTTADKTVRICYLKYLERARCLLSVLVIKPLGRVSHTPPPAARYIGSVSIYWCLYSLKLVYCSILL